jgi:adenylate cyclase
VAVDREELRRRGIWDPEAPNAEDRLALLEVLWERGATFDLLERGRHDLGAVSADLSIRGPGPRLTLSEAAVRAGVEVDQAATILRALGFPEPGPDEPVFTETEADLFGFFVVLDQFGADVGLQLVRVMGSSLARIADAAVAALRLNFETPLRSSGGREVDVSQLADTLLPLTAEAMDLILRRYLVSSAYQAWEVDPLRASTTATLAVGFADVVGFTALARSIPTDELVAVIGSFERDVIDLVTDRGGRVVKLIGDEVMFVMDDPRGAARLALELTHRFADDARVPPLRVGLSYGSVLTRDGDFYGPVVNTASRLVELAEPSGVVVSENVQESLGGTLPTEAMAPTRVKGYDEPIRAYRLRPGP